MKIFALLVHFSFGNASDGSSEEERLGFYPGVETVYCECAINVILKGEARDMTFAEAPGTPKAPLFQKLILKWSKVANKTLVKSWSLYVVDFWHLQAVSQLYNHK